LDGAHLGRPHDSSHVATDLESSVAPTALEQQDVSVHVSLDQADLHDSVQFFNQHLCHGPGARGEHLTHPAPSTAPDFQDVFPIDDRELGMLVIIREVRKP
jgi:hypothetical protein